jgi:hypothetical protein
MKPLHIWLVVLALLIAGASLSYPLWRQETPPQSASSGGQFDGPAELPRVYVRSTLSDTPAPGRVRSVGPDSSLQKALDEAACGDTIKLTAGANYVGTFTLPAKKCDDAHWIVIRTSAPDASLPAEGQRLTPCYAGVASLPGRPPLQCASTQNVLPKIVSTGKPGNGPLIFADGANHYRLMGLEIARAEGGGTAFHLASIERGGVADHIVFDRVWMHGTPQDEIKGGIQLGGSRYVAVVDSYFSDFHCIARTGACTDAHAIGGGVGKNPMGPYKIVNNYLEASGENIMFGGGAAMFTPADIEIRRNHLFKPLIWMRGSPGFVGGSDGQPFIVKNLFELKNAQRVLFEGNVLENSWGGFSQAGFAILLTPKNQAVKGENICPGCQVTDITIRYSVISHAAAGMQISNGQSDAGGVARDGQRYSLHDLIMDDINGRRYAGPGKLFQVSNGPNAPLLQNIRIDHITAFPTDVLFNLGGRYDRKMANFTLSNSIVTAGGRSEFTATGGGPSNCAHGAPRMNPKDVFDNCFDQYTVTHNVIIDSEGKWPAGNFPVKNAEAVGFVRLGGGDGPDYRLRPDSKFKKAGSDGKDIGADVEAVAAAVAGVR